MLAEYDKIGMPRNAISGITLAIIDEIEAHTWEEAVSVFAAKSQSQIDFWTDSGENPDTINAPPSPFKLIGNVSVYFCQKHLDKYLVSIPVVKFSYSSWNE